MRLLIVEDEPLIALALEDMLDELGCVVVGCAGALIEALALTGDRSLSINGAILDIDLHGERAYPAAALLAATGVPFAFCSSLDRSFLAAPS